MVCIFVATAAICEPIFGTGGAQKLAEKYHTQLLGQMPLHISLREILIAVLRRR
ncbi:hypothetical protein KCP74_14645 [Salmonella enterica subsp. enterica]|nr:hypothetical protein KCP74_14645 [Salmonella enterica subsp. enterica]